MTPHLRLGLVGSALALAVALSCKTFDLPSEICDPSGVDALRTISNEPADGMCSRCLEDHCCDKVGVCANTNGCADLVRQTQGCVLDAGIKGATTETVCAAGLTSIREANDTYQCMREQCGTQCGLPVCKVASSATLFRTADCDRCITGSCCVELNACYESRACKLSIECIAKECGLELGKALDDLAARGGVPDAPPLPDGAAPDFCQPSMAAVFDAPACVRNCLCLYEHHDQGLEPPDASMRPLNLAKHVYDCAGRAGCGSSCGDAGAP